MMGQLVVKITRRTAAGGAAGDNDEIIQLCRMMRIMSERDTEATVAEVMRALLRQAAEKPVGSTEVSRITHLNRITCIHHLKRLEVAGVVQREGVKYRLRSANAEELVNEMRRDTLRMFTEMNTLARDIDEDFALRKRRMLYVRREERR